MAVTPFRSQVLREFASSTDLRVASSLPELDGDDEYAQRKRLGLTAGAE